MKRWYQSLSRGDRAAHIYRSDAEQVRVVTDTISWMDEDHRLVLLSDRWDAENRAPRSRVLEAAVEDGHMTILPAKATLCPSGTFSERALEDLIRLETDTVIDDERPGLVIMWDLDWLGSDPEAFETHIVQQSAMSLSPSGSRATLIGQYGAAHFSAEQIERVLRVSPMVLEGGTLTRKFWVVSKNSVGKTSKGGRTLQGPAEAAKAR